MDKFNRKKQWIRKLHLFHPTNTNMSLRDHDSNSSSTDDSLHIEITTDLIQNYIFQYFNDNDNYDKYIHSEQSKQSINSNINKDRQARKNIESDDGSDAYENEIIASNSLSSPVSDVVLTVTNAVHLELIILATKILLISITVI